MTSLTKKQKKSQEIVKNLWWELHPEAHSIRVVLADQDEFENCWVAYVHQNGNSQETAFLVNQDGEQL